MDIKKIIEDSISTKTLILADIQLLKRVESVVEVIVDAYKHQKKVLLCGNGGSAADAQHIAAELTGRFYYDRPPLFAEALHVNSSYVTAVGNDYGYDEIFARYIRAAGVKGDVLIGISTSGNSSNIIKAMGVAHQIGMTNVAMTGESGGEMKQISDYLLNVPSSVTPRIQESHIMIGHIICEFVESILFPKK